MASYTIMISERQRVALTALLAHARSTPIDLVFPGQLGSVRSDQFVDDADMPCVEMLHSLFEALPAQEAEFPEALHGFCL